MLAPPAASAEDLNQFRSIVDSRPGVVATSHALATQAGVRVLEKGGSAVDGAIAANAVLSVVEPMMCGRGGDLFFLHRDAGTGRLEGLNASGWAPRGQSAQWLREQGHTAMPASGIHAVTVPGAVAGWQAAHCRFVRLPWKGLFAEAIALAEEGRPVQAVIASLWQRPRLGGSEPAARVCLPAAKAGEVLCNPALARTFHRIDKGARRFTAGRLLKPSSPQAAKTGAGSKRRTRPNSSPNGWSRSPPRTAAGASQSCRPTGRAWPRC